MRPLIAAVAVLLFAGLGCAGTQAPPVIPSANANAPAESVNGNANVPANADLSANDNVNLPAADANVPTTGAIPLTTTVALDDTWKTYANASQNFEFRWPSKGRYAPDWEVTFVADSDAAIKDGCYFTSLYERRPPGRVSVGGVEFCRTSYVDGAAGSQYLINHYATLKGSRYIVISFTKKAYSASAVGCTGFDLSVSSTVCVEFDETAYLELLDQSVSTFRYK